MKTFTQFVTEIKRLFPLTTATARADKNEKAARDAYKAGDKKTAWRHLDAADRYKRIAKGKAPFKKD